MIEGIDVSHWQGRFDWSVPGIAFAWMKATGDRNTPLFVDAQYPRNREETRRLGIPAGPYHFFLGGVVSGVDQARYFRQVAGPTEVGDLVPALDLEDPPGGRIVLTRQDCRALIQETAQQFGEMPAIYCGEGLFQRFTWFVEEVAACPLWLANWTRRPARPHAVWQHTEVRLLASGVRVDGNKAESLAPVLVVARHDLSTADLTLLVEARDDLRAVTRTLG